MLIAAAAEVSVRSPRLGALIVALPIVSLLTMSVLWMQTQEAEKIATHSEATFWLVIPSLPMFLILPYLLRHNWTYWPALSICILITVVLFTLFKTLFGLSF